MKIDLTIPSELKEMKLVDYQNYMKVTEENDDETFLDQKLIEIFCKVKLIDVEKLPLIHLEEASNIIKKTFEEQPRFIKKFEMNGVKYGFIPDLEKISSGEYADLNQYLGKDSELHKVMAILFRPITKEKNNLYNIEKYEGSDKYGLAMKDAPMDVVLSAQVFFYNLGKELMRLTQVYLAKEIQTNSHLKQTLEKNGVGTLSFMQSLKEIYSNSMTLPNLDYINV